MSHPCGADLYREPTMSDRTWLGSPAAIYQAAIETRRAFEPNGAFFSAVVAAIESDVVIEQNGGLSEEQRIAVQYGVLCGAAGCTAVSQAVTKQEEVVALVA